MAARSRDFARTGAGRDFNASGFALGATEEEDFDPMSGTSNLVDAMLVFACGLLLGDGFGFCCGLFFGLGLRRALLHVCANTLHRMFGIDRGLRCNRVLDEQRFGVEIARGDACDANLFVGQGRQPGGQIEIAFAAHQLAIKLQKHLLDDSAGIVRSAERGM